LEVYRKLSTAIQSGLIRTAHDCSEGGLAIALAEMCIGGRCGAFIDIDGIGPGDAFSRLWSESLGRIVVSVEAEHEVAFVEMMEGADLHLIGMVSASSELLIEDGYDTLIQADVEQLTESWKGALDMTGVVE
jgi:phosphoribosylformylglycinamidine synthase